MPSSHLRYVDPGVAPAYVPLSHTVIEPPFAACFPVAPLPACAAKAAPATSRAAQTSVTRPRLELFIRVSSRSKRFDPPLSRRNGGQGSVDYVHPTGDVGRVVRAQEHDELAHLARQPEPMRRHGLEDARLVDRTTRGVPVPHRRAQHAGGD